MVQEEILQLAKSLQAEIIETHISWVLLTDKFAYKIKKPIKTSFLDFSTKARRKKFCFEELRLNKSLAPNMYLEVVCIIQKGKDFLLVSNSKRPIEYAVKMKKLDASRQMNVVLSKKSLREGDIKKLSKKIAEFHLRTRVLKKGKSLPEMVYNFNDLLSLKNEIISFLGEKEFIKMNKAIEVADSFLSKRSKIFSERIKKGFIRECHGDLHAANIFLYKHPILFDRIEFNDKFKNIDVLQDLSFLSMDLEIYGYKNFSDKLIEQYIKFTKMSFGENEKLIWNYYKCYAANVRAKVGLLGIKNKKDLGNIKKYLKLMYHQVNFYFKTS